MPALRELRFKGVDLSALVTAWGAIEQIKDVLLVTAQAMTSEMSVEVANRGSMFASGGVSSLVSGMDWYNAPLQVSVDGEVVFDGLVKNVRLSATGQTATIVSENILKRPAEATMSYATPGANPGDAMLGVLAAAGIAAEYVDAASFSRAGVPARQAGAKIVAAYAAGSSTGALSALQGIGDLASISVFVLNNRITARGFLPYEGSEAGLRYELNDGNVREWGDREFDTSAFNNRVSVGYPVGLFVVQDDLAARRSTGVVRNLDFPATGAVYAADRASAAFFAGVYLQRAAPRKMLLPIAGGREFANIVIGDRFPVTNARLGLSRFPMEAIEIRRSLDTEEVELRLASLGPT